MISILISIYLVFLVAYIYLICMLTRNYTVYEFRCSIIDMCYEWNENNNFKEDAYDWCYNKMPSYDDMIFSFKPLKLDAWLTKEMIEKFNN